MRNEWPAPGQGTECTITGPAVAVAGPMTNGPRFFRSKRARVDWTLRLLDGVEDAYGRNRVVWRIDHVISHEAGDTADNRNSAPDPLREFVRLSRLRFHLANCSIHDALPSIARRHTLASESLLPFSPTSTRRMRRCDNAGGLDALFLRHGGFTRRSRPSCGGVRRVRPAPECVSVAREMNAAEGKNCLRTGSPASSRGIAHAQRHSVDRRGSSRRLRRV